MVVTAALVAAIALQYGQGQANPKGALAAIFGIIGAFIVLLFVFQLRDVAASGVPAEGVFSPTTLDEPALWVMLAIRPIDDDAVRARKQIWSSTRSGIHTGMVICALIFLAVPPIYLLDTFVPLLIGAPLIFGIALWKSIDLLRRGGGLDQVYERASRAMAPLGLAVVERPSVTIEPVGFDPVRMGPRMHGALVLEGERYGREVTVTMPAGRGVRSPSAVTVATHTPQFEFRARDGRLKAQDGAPEGIRATLERMPGSTRWNGVRGSGGAGGITVNRKQVAGGGWLLDLWLAESLAGSSY